MEFEPTTASVPGQETHALTIYDIWAWRLGATGSLLSCTSPLCSQVFRSERLLLSALVLCHVYENFKCYIPARPIQNYFVLSAESILSAQGTQKVINITLHICLGNIFIRFGIPKREQSGNEHEFAIDNFDLLYKLKDLIEGFMSSHSKTILKCYCSLVYL